MINALNPRCFICFKPRLGVVLYYKCLFSDCGRCRITTNGSQAAEALLTDYSNVHLQNCLEVIRSCTMTQRQAADHYKIPRSTIKNELKKLFPSTAGHPKVFTQEEELSFASHIDKMCDFGFPIDELDLRFIVKDYVTRQGKNIPCFRDWTKSFLKRHPQLTVKFASNIKRNRAQIDEKTISDYYDNLSNVVKDVPPQNIYNYDEKCMADDPGEEKVICRRGKYPERIMNSTKSNISVMFCGNTNGESVAPYLFIRLSICGPHGRKVTLLVRDTTG